MQVELSNRVSGTVTYACERFGKLKVDNVKTLEVHINTCHLERIDMRDIKVGDRFSFEIMPDGRQLGWLKAINLRRLEGTWNPK
jgi:hypothetical protein